MPDSQRLAGLVTAAELLRAGYPRSRIRAILRSGRLIQVGRGRVDFLWREHRTVGEADGAAKYADPRRARAQLERDARLRAAGFEVVHFGWRELAIAPAQVIGQIRLAFARSDRLRARPPA